MEVTRLPRGYLDHIQVCQGVSQLTEAILPLQRRVPECTAVKPAEWDMKEKVRHDDWFLPMWWPSVAATTPSVISGS